MFNHSNLHKTTSCWITDIHIESRLYHDVFVWFLCCSDDINNTKINENLQNKQLRDINMDFNSTLNESVNFTDVSFNETEQKERYYSQLFGMDLSMPEWEALLTILALGLVIIITIVGKYDYLNIFIG